MTAVRATVYGVTSGACPRCGAVLVPPGPYDSTWRCAVHGSVTPWRALTHVGLEALRHLVRHADVPVWWPEPLPGGWQHTGSAVVGDERRFRAVVSAFCLPHPLGGRDRAPAEALIVSEDPGVGVGASYAGLPGARQAAALELTDHIGGEAHARLDAAGRPTALWSLPAAADRCAYLGEAAGVWLWFIGFPAEAGWVLLDELSLIDARFGLPHDVETGPVTGRIQLR